MNMIQSEKKGSIIDECNDNLLATHETLQLLDQVTEYVKGCWDIWQKDQENLQESCIDDSLKKKVFLQG